MRQTACPVFKTIRVDDNILLFNYTTVGQDGMSEPEFNVD